LLHQNIYTYRDPRHEGVFGWLTVDKYLIWQMHVDSLSVYSDVLNFTSTVLHWGTYFSQMFSLAN